MENKTNPQPPQVGDAVIYTNTLGQDVNAIVCAAWGNDPFGAISVAYVSTDPGMQDNYGRQVGRAASVVHATRQGAPGNYWRRAGEERVKVTVPAT